MILYSCIAVPVAVLIISLGISIYKGKIQLIHNYHQTNVEDTENYCKEFGFALCTVAIGPFFSGIIALSGDDSFTLLLAVIILFAGIFAGLFSIYSVQKKYNSGVF